MLDIAIDRKAYPDRGGAPHVALAGLHLAAAPGEFVCVVGPSGCGKSTLLNVVGGLDRDVDGRVRLAGADAAHDIGFMFQEPRLMPWLTVLDNVLLVTGASPAARLRACELLAAMGLGDVLDAFPGRLSGGMQRRVALARAFVIEPKLLLMDEPFVSLDVPTANRLRAMLVELWQRSRATVLFVTHDLREALALADRICFLSPAPGRVVLELPIVLPRPRLPDDAAVQTLQAELLAQHPELLAGLATSPDGTTDE
ncbi:ABC transporter, sulfonate transport system ATP-binding protein [Azoarcus sp. CIB]|uniref:ABC transporter ATP-binding protein n=1 Tax=Aromatoleum sp. (strain CIB) TaxID=198107 RepID=UPI00067C583B|nr:ABC transporter ATP-binding protein [Azoarcus sp. CIB]AKU10989.1 ABC transporter, sulfonate transport system ATP-binding protein [Azoarcus sp. CIB]